MSNSTITSSTSIATDSSTTSSTSDFISSTSSDISTSSSDVTITSTAPSAAGTTNVVTSVITAPTSSGQTSPSQVVVVITSISSGTVTAAITETASQTTASSQTTSSGAAALTGNGSNNGSGKHGGGGGLGTAGTVAIAVVIPVVVVALLVIAGILLWRKRKQKKENAEQRRKEVEDYGYNPNSDPTIPAVAHESPEMTEDNSGYRGWGGAAGAMSNRKASTTLSGGQHGQYSESGSNAYHSPSSPGNGDGHSGDPLVNSRGTMGSDDFPLGPAAGGAAAGGAVAGGAMLHSERNANQIHRGPSNASSRYSTGAHSGTSDDAPPMPPIGAAYDFNPGAGYGFGQHGPYGDGTYGGGADAGGAGGMPVVRDVSARRNTRIQQPGQYQQGNSGIAQNF